MSVVNIDEWFKKIRERFANEMQCGRGCTLCCHGLFDISLADAVSVAKGFGKLAPDAQKQVQSKAVDLQAAIQGSLGSKAVPTLLGEDDSRIDRAVDSANNPPCPCLGESGECLIYDDRPMACRLEGVPMIDVRDGLFGDWCELNFKDGVPENAAYALRQDYDLVDTIEETRSAAVASQAGLSDHRAVTFIPSVIAEFESFWGKLGS